MQEITVSNLRIDLIKKNIKNMHLSVHPPNGRVRIAVPRNTNEEQVRMYIISKLDWIRKQQKKLASQNRISAREKMIYILTCSSFVFRGTAIRTLPFGGCTDKCIFLIFFLIKSIRKLETVISCISNIHLFVL